MTPFQRKTRSLTKQKYLPQLFPNLPERLPDEQLKELVIKLRSGDFSVVNAIVESHLRLGFYIASRYCSQYRNKAEDIIGTMQLSLIETVRKSKRLLRDNNITPYIVTNLHGDITKFIAEDHIVRISKRTKNNWILKGSDKIDKILKQGQEVPVSVENEEIITIDKLEEINKVANGYIEKRVIQLRAEGYTMEEIGPQVGFSTSNVQIIVRSIEEKYKRRMG